MSSPAYTLYTAPTPNGWKISVLLEELGVKYNVRALDVRNGKDHKAEPFLKINPNGRVPALVDHEEGDLRVFESGAIMYYLAQKHGRFFPKDLKAQAETMSWVMWQMGGVGPMTGQLFFFLNSAPEKIEYAINRYRNETERLFQTLETALEGKEWLANNEFSIADMILFPWVLPAPMIGISLEDKPNIKRWLAACQARPGAARGLDVPEPNRFKQVPTPSPST